MAQALLHPLISPPNLKLFSSCKSRSQSPVVSIRKLQSLVLQASKDDMSQVYLISHPYRCINSTLIRRRCLSVSRGSNDDMEVMKNIVETVPSAVPLFLLNLPSWANWLWGALVFLALPFYGRVRRVQDRLEATVDAVAETVENVAEKVEKISCEMADALPEGTLKEIVLTVEKTADIIDKGAEKTEILIDKLDDIETKVDAFVDPSTKGEAASKEVDERKQV